MATTRSLLKIPCQVTFAEEPLKNWIADTAPPANSSSPEKAVECASRLKIWAIFRWAGFVQQFASANFSHSSLIMHIPAGHAHTQIEIPAKLLHYFLWSNKSNINHTSALSSGQYTRKEMIWKITTLLELFSRIAHLFFMSVFKLLMDRCTSSCSIIADDHLARLLSVNVRDVLVPCMHCEGAFRSGPTF